MEKRSLCVFDLDNTLFDWVAIWHAMFSAKLAEVVKTIWNDRLAIVSS